MFPFTYSVVTINPFMDEEEYNLESGMGLANSYSEAANYLEAYYGNDLVRITNLMLHEESNLITLPHEVVKNYEKDEEDDRFHHLKCNIEGVIL